MTPLAFGIKIRHDVAQPSPTESVSVVPPQRDWLLGRLPVEDVNEVDALIAKLIGSHAGEGTTPPGHEFEARRRADLRDWSAIEADYASDPRLMAWLLGTKTAISNLRGSLREAMAENGSLRIRCETAEDDVTALKRVLWLVKP